MELIIVIVLVLLLIGSFPVFPYSRDWGYRGSGGLGSSSSFSGRSASSSTLHRLI